MVARPSIAVVVVMALSSLGASYRTQNFVVEAPTPQFAQQVAQYAETYRKEKAVQNSLDVVRFAGSGDVLGFTTTGQLAAWTIFVVCGGLDVATNAINYVVAETGAGMIVGGTDATLKRFYREGDKVRLQPSNAKMKPIMVPAADVQIQGRVIGVLRKY